MHRQSIHSASTVFCTRNCHLFQDGLFYENTDETLMTAKEKKRKTENDDLSKLTWSNEQ